MATKKAKTASFGSKTFTLFQHKNFTIAFFMAVFALLGGAIYLMTTSAATRYLAVNNGVSLSACRLSTTNNGRVNLYLKNGNTKSYQVTVSNNGGTPQSIYGTTVAARTTYVASNVYLNPNQGNWKLNAKPAGGAATGSTGFTMYTGSLPRC